MLGFKCFPVPLVPYTIHSIPKTTYHTRIHMFMWSSGPLLNPLRRLGRRKLRPKLYGLPKAATLPSSHRSHWSVGKQGSLKGNCRVPLKRWSLGKQGSCKGNYRVPFKRWRGIKTRLRVVARPLEPREEEPSLPNKP